MKKLLFILLIALTVSPLLGQDYQAGVASRAYQLLGRDTIFPTKSIYENIKNTRQFTVMTKIFELTDAQDAIDDLGMCTVFLPTDNAFAQYSEEQMEQLLSPSNAVRLKAALMNHIVIGRMDSHSLLRNIAKNNGSTFFRSPAAIDTEFTTERLSTYLQVPGAPRAKLIKLNYYHKNGFLHVVDAFLIEQ